MTVYFIGAGPGDPELITVKGQRLIRSCPVIIYAGSLVPEAVLEGHQAETVVNSAELHLEQIIDLIKSAHAKGQDVARVHSGDPSLYGAIGEQIRYLRELDIPFEIIPGVTATAACAALLGAELTLPDVSQSVILTRYADKTAMPAGEELGNLAQHGATMAIHLGVNHLEKILAELLPHYGADCPIAVIHRATWAGSGLGDGDAGGYCRESCRQRVSAYGADPCWTSAGQRSFQRIVAVSCGACAPLQALKTIVARELAPAGSRSDPKIRQPIHHG
jgi:precorrin-4/cobalt-precorrin-4 C11-methyltransferase